METWSQQVKPLENKEVFAEVPPKQQSEKIDGEKSGYFKGEFGKFHKN